MKMKSKELLEKFLRIFTLLLSFFLPIMVCYIWYKNDIGGDVITITVITFVYLVWFINSKFSYRRTYQRVTKILRKYRIRFQNSYSGIFGEYANLVDFQTSRLLKALEKIGYDDIYGYFVSTDHIYVDEFEKNLKCIKDKYRIKNFGKINKYVVASCLFNALIESPRLIGPESVDQDKLYCANLYLALICALELLRKNVNIKQLIDSGIVDKLDYVARSSCALRDSERIVLSIINFSNFLNLSFLIS